MAKRLMARMLGMFRSRTQVGVDRAGNNYFSLVEEVDGASTCSRDRPFPSKCSSSSLATRTRAGPEFLMERCFCFVMEQ